MGSGWYINLWSIEVPVPESTQNMTRCVRVSASLVLFAVFFVGWG